MSKYTGFLLGIALIALIAFKPWHVVNRAVGLTPSDSLASRVDSMAKTEQDSIFIETVPMVLSAPVADSLVKQVEARTRYHDHLSQKEAELTAENERLAIKEREIEKKIELKKKLIEQKEQHLISLEQVNELIVRQKRPPKSSDIDSRTGLIKGSSHP